MPKTDDRKKRRRKKEYGTLKPRRQTPTRANIHAAFTNNEINKRFSQIPYILRYGIENNGGKSTSKLSAENTSDAKCNANPWLAAPKAAEPSPKGKYYELFILISFETFAFVCLFVFCFNINGTQMIAFHAFAMALRNLCTRGGRQRCGTVRKTERGCFNLSLLCDMFYLLGYFNKHI